MTFTKFSTTFLVFHLFCAFRPVYSDSCSVPDDWLWNAGEETVVSPNEPEALGSNVHQGTKWPNGVVPYKLHPSLTKTDREHVAAAFKEYHTKTCVQFHRYNDEDDFVSIEVNDSVCGLAHVCKKGGYQFARFGSRCRNKHTMIHELGHALCLGHEHQRANRDKHVSYIYCNQSDADPNLSNKLPGYKSKGIYDYSSQMHYECGKCTLGGILTNEYVKECGPQKTSGLSVLDVDTINELYNCQSCYRHRWIPIDHFTDNDKGNLYNFGFVDPFEGPLYPCRARLKDHIVVGKFEFKNRVCHAGWNRQEYFLREDFEILTIPGGLKNGDSEYALVRVYNQEGGTNKTRLSYVFETAVVAGELDEDLKAGFGRGYVAYATVTESSIACDLKGSLENFDTIGKVYDRENTFTQRFPICHKEVAIKEFFILVCLGNRNKQILKSFYDHHRDKIVRHIKYIKVSNPLASGKNISLLAQVPSDAEEFYVTLAKHRAGNPVMFDFNAYFTTQEKTVNMSSTISNGESRYFGDFPVVRGANFTLVITCEDAQFQVKVNDHFAGTLEYRLPLKDTRYLIVRGDVDVIEVNGVNVQGEVGYYRRSFQNLEKYYDLSSEMNDRNDTNNRASYVSHDLEELASRDVLMASGNRDADPSTGNSFTSTSTEANDSMTTANIFLMFGVGFVAIIFVAVALERGLGKVFRKKREYNDVPVIYTNK